MKKLFLYCVSACLASAAMGQRGYFLYLQTDDQSPFYVRMADKIYSSSTAGYLILPNLPDSTYNFGIGFARSTQPETRFAVTVNQNDRGYLIKNFSEGLALFDMQELSIVKSANAARDNTVYETKTDKFSSVLSKAADDPGLLKVPVAKKEEPRQETASKETATQKVEETVVKKETPSVSTPKPNDSVSAVVVVTDTAQTQSSAPVPSTAQPANPEKAATEKMLADTSLINREEPKTEEPKPELPVAQATQPYKPSTVTRRSESSTTEGFGIVFLDRYDDRTDTVRILIPPSKVNPEDEVPTANLSQIEKREATRPVEEPVESKPPVVQRPDDAMQKPAPGSVKGLPAQCRDVASDKDFLKLRKNMAAESNDEAMIEEARKVFRNKCFSTEQVRYLSTLFLTSAAKYQFFDASYNRITDPQSFSTLQTEIKDEYYLKRFKALVGE